MKYGSVVVFALTLAPAPVAFATTPMEGMDTKPAGQARQASKPIAVEVRKVYLDTNKITLKHGPIDNLGMGAMTVTSAAKDKAPLQHFKEGRAARAVFDMVDGQPTVIDLRSKQEQVVGGARPFSRASPHVPGLK